jgi:glutamyl-tRNA reductase
VIVVVGLSHKSASIEVRERLALPLESHPDVLRALIRGSSIGEALVVSTCNRVEFVVAGSDGPRSNLDEVARAVVEGIVTHAPGIDTHLYRHVGGEAVRHLFRVAASLDSLVVGEPQILGQLKDAYDVAREAGTAGTVLNRVVPRAIKSAKRVRSETTIGTGLVSVPSVAVDLARQIFGDLSRHTAALVGSGEMAETVAKLLRQAGCRLVVVGRNLERVTELAGALGGEGRGLQTLDATLVEADVVITATSAPGFVVDAPRVRKARKARKGRSLFFIDLAVPRDVDPRAGDLDGVFVYNVDDLSKVVAESLEGRKREAERAERIVVEEAESYDRWAEAEQVTPTIVALRERLRRILEGEVERSLSGRLRHLGPSDREALLVMVEAALNKMLHPPTTRLRRMATTKATRPDLEQTLAALGELFELGEGTLSQPPQDGSDPPPLPSDTEGPGEDEPEGEPPPGAGVREAS